MARALLSRGERVVGLDNLNAYYDPALKRARLALVEAAAAGPTGGAFVFDEADLSDGAALAALLARELCLQWGIPLAHALGRSDGHGAQRGSAGAARRAQVQGAFHVVGDVPLHCVLVDDVVTTGSTLSSAARALRAAGCARVGAVALARVALRAPGTRVGIRQIQSGGMRTWNSM